MIRAKFLVESVTKRKAGYSGIDYTYEAELRVVYGNSEENKQFFAATPSGVIKLSTVRNNMFEVGEEYYVDFTKAIKE